MTEHDLYGPIVKGANADGMYLYRIHDGGGVNPFDIGGVCACGIGVAIEVKVTDTLPGGLHWHKFESQQIIWLRKYAEVGALSIVIIHYRKHSILRASRLITEGNFDRTAILPASQQLQIKKDRKDGNIHGLRFLCSNCSVTI